LQIKTGAAAATANAWDIRPRCFSTLAAPQNNVVAVTFWMRAVTAPDDRGLTSFVLQRNRRRLRRWVCAAQSHESPNQTP
jgi:hypothetical protein